MIQNKTTVLSDLWESLKVSGSIGLQSEKQSKKKKKILSVYLHISLHIEDHEFETFSTVLGTQQVFNKYKFNEYMNAEVITV